MSPQATHPTSIRIFLADGTPEGIRLVGKSNWTGKAIVAGRAQLAEALGRDEMGQPGVYVLIGPGESGLSRIYIGEADVLNNRLRNHQRNKDFWTRFVAFTSTDESLNKAHIRYLESKLVALARRANQWEIDNSTDPAEPSLSEADRADAEWFLREMLVIYPILGVDAFESAAEGSIGGRIRRTPVVESEGRGREGQGGDRRFRGALRLQSPRNRDQLDPCLYERITEQLLDKGVLVRDGKLSPVHSGLPLCLPLNSGRGAGRRSRKRSPGMEDLGRQDAEADPG